MSERNVLAPRALITQSHTKRTTAAAISAAKARNGWSNSDAADALGCCEGTIRNRLDTDAPNNQMTVHELLRSLQSDGRGIANDILAAVEYEVQPKDLSPDRTCDRKKASSITRALLAVSGMLEDGLITDDEICARRKELEEGRDAFDKLLSRIGPRRESAR